MLQSYKYNWIISNQRDFNNVKVQNNFLKKHIQTWIPFVLPAYQTIAYCSRVEWFKKLYESTIKNKKTGRR